MTWKKIEKRLGHKKRPNSRDFSVKIQKVIFKLLSAPSAKLDFGSKG
jgi:hypothetical protein